jgi:flagellar basal-body rod protein FlgB
LKSLVFPFGWLRAFFMSMLEALGQNLERYMDLLSARQKLVAGNLANADTPGYKTRDIDFHFEVMSALSAEPPDVVEVAGLATRNDGNNVSLDRETSLLAENAMRFNVAANLVKSQSRMLRAAIQDGRSS